MPFLWLPTGRSINHVFSLAPRVPFISAGERAMSGNSGTLAGDLYGFPTPHG